MLIFTRHTSTHVLSAHAEDEVLTHLGLVAVRLALPGFYSLGWSVSPIFGFLYRFVYRFYTISEKMKTFL